MKNALVRLLTLATLASSLSGFAMAGDSKRNDSANTSANQQSGCADTSQGKKHKKDKQTQQDESQQEKDFDRVLMGTHG